MSNIFGKRLLVLGGKPIGSCEIVEYAKNQGVYTIVTDYLPKEKSPAKRIADESWDLSTAEVDKISDMVKSQHIDGIYTGVHEFNVTRMIEICERTGLPCFCSLKQWNTLINKREFKKLCRQYGIPVAKEYKISCSSDVEKEIIDYPVIIKPADGSGSRGFKICENIKELQEGFASAATVSKTGQILVEEKMDYHESVIINYTLFDGNIIFSGISDKYSEKAFEDGAPIMAVQFYPATCLEEYLSTLDEKVKRMFSETGLKNGVIWIEAFYKNGQFTFNEMGYRFGGSLTYYPVERVSGIEQLQAQIEFALTGRYSRTYINKQKYEKVYTIMPVHVKPGRITAIHGLEQLVNSSQWLHYVPVHYVGDTIENWGSAQQVFAYIHFETDTREASEQFADEILNTLKVFDESGNNLLFNLYR